MLAEGNMEGQEVLHDAIPSLYASARSASPCTSAILSLAWVTSAPFATVSQRMDAARRKYGEAVVKLRNALQDPCTAKADDALFAVILILLLEVLKPFACLFCFRCRWVSLLTSGLQNMTATSKSMPNPIMHIRGVIMLVNFRGLGNFANELARKIFFFVKLTLVCLDWPI